MAAESRNSSNGQSKGVWRHAIWRDVNVRISRPAAISRSGHGPNAGRKYQRAQATPVSARSRVEIKDSDSLVREQIVGEKIQALLSRGKARDFYDLYFILRANLLSAESKAVLPQVLEKLRRIRIDFKKELKEFLPRSQWAIIRNFLVALEREIERFL
jgi:hypothetical protein